MKNIIYNLSLFPLLLLTSGQLMGSDLFFVPFQFQTYIPITPETIKCRAVEVFHIEQQSYLDKLHAILRPGNKAKFNDQLVRVFVSIDNQQVFIDAEGVALISKDSFRIDKSEFEKFIVLLRANPKTKMPKSIDIVK